MPSVEVDLVGELGDLLELAARAIREERHPLDQVDLLVPAQHKEECKRPVRPGKTEPGFRTVWASVSKVIVEEGRFVPSFRPLLLLPLVLAAVLLPGAAQSAATATQLNVTVGPGFSIKVADANGQTVSHLDPGDYSITIKNLSPSAEHNFHLTGPAVSTRPRPSTTSR